LVAWGITLLSAGGTGHWRVLAQPYVGELLELILTNAAAHGWQLSAMPERGCVDEMGDHPAAVVKHCLRLFSDADAAGTNKERLCWEV